MDFCGYIPLFFVVDNAITLLNWFFHEFRGFRELRGFHQAVQYGLFNHLGSYKNIMQFQINSRREKRSRDT